MIKEESMRDIAEKNMWKVGGLLILIPEIALGWALSKGLPFLGDSGSLESWAEILGILAFSLTMSGFFIVHPNEAKAFVFFGSYVGSARDQGFFWTNPLVKRKSISLRVRNFVSQTLKVNDSHGNPIEIAAVVVWRVADSAKALYNVDSFETFVHVQSETALRNLAGRFPYDSTEPAAHSLRGSQDEVAQELKLQLGERLAVAGIEIDEARLSHLAYAPEIAQAMLRRQQAEAVIAARRLIVDGAVGMVQMALTSLEEQNVVKLDDERRASMVNNLLVALVSESEAQPVINTGTLYA
jgi:regulator of protease activity HflC (stomatin/prohibitin superfamily)